MGHFSSLGEAEAETRKAGESEEEGNSMVVTFKSIYIEEENTGATLLSCTLMKQPNFQVFTL